MGPQWVSSIACPYGTRYCCSAALLEHPDHALSWRTPCKQAWHCYRSWSMVWEDRRQQLVLASARRTETRWKGCRMLHGFLLSRSHSLALVGCFGEIMKELPSLGCDREVPSRGCVESLALENSISISQHMIFSVSHCLMPSQSRDNKPHFITHNIQ